MRDSAAFLERSLNVLKRAWVRKVPTELFDTVRSALVSAGESMSECANLIGEFQGRVFLPALLVHSFGEVRPLTLDWFLDKSATTTSFFADPRGDRPLLTRTSQPHSRLRGDLRERDFHADRGFAGG